MSIRDQIRTKSSTTYLSKVESTLGKTASLLHALAIYKKRDKIGSLASFVVTTFDNVVEACVEMFFDISGTHFEPPTFFCAGINYSIHN